MLDRGVAGDGTAVGGHDERLDRDAETAQVPAQSIEVAAHDGADVGVCDGGARPLVLPDVGHDVGRDRDRDLRRHARDGFGHLPLVRRIEIGVQEAHRHRLEAARPDLACEAIERTWVGRRERRTVRVHPFVDLEDVRAGDERTRHLDVEVEDVVAVPARELEHVAKPAGDDQRGARTAALDERVGREGRPVDPPRDPSRLQISRARAPRGRRPEPRGRDPCRR